MEVLRPHGVVVALEGQQLAVLPAVRGRQPLGVPRRDERVLRAVPCTCRRRSYAAAFRLPSYGLYAISVSREIDIGLEQQ